MASQFGGVPVESQSKFGGIAVQPTQAEPEQTAGEFAAGAGQSLLQGATLGFSDEIQSVIAAAVASPFIKDKTFGQIMVDARESFRADQEKFKEQNPATALGLEVAGSVATGGLGAVKGGVTAAKGLGQAVARSAATGGATGTVAGAGFADADELLSLETAESAATTGLAGLALGGLTPLAIKAAVAAGKLIPKETPRALLESALKIRPGVAAKDRTRMVETALSEGIMPTVKGLEKITKTITDLDVGLNKIIDGATDRGVLISKKALFTQLKKLRQGLGGAKLDAAKDVGQINKVAKAFDEQLKLINKQKLTPREVQDMKRAAYQRIKFDVNQLNAKFAETEAKKGIVRGAKESLESIDPNVKTINLREGDLLQLGDELERVVSRLDNRNLISLDTAVKIGSGAAAGPAGGVAGVGASVLGAPRVKARTALLLENLRKTSELSDGLGKLSPEAAAPLAVLFEGVEGLLKQETESLE